VLLQPGQVRDPGGDLVAGVVAERLDVHQVEASFGLGGQVIAVGGGRRWDHPLAGARVVTAFP
jgi:hypothetical protein